MEILIKDLCVLDLKASLKICLENCYRTLKIPRARFFVTFYKKSQANNLLRKAKFS